MKSLLIVFLGFIVFSCTKPETKTSENTETKKDAKASILGVDPVCGMDVSDSTYKADHEGKSYHFCAEHCKDEFLKDPKSFLSSATKKMDK